MNVSNLTSVLSTVGQAPAVVNANGGGEAQRSASSGKILPASGQNHQPQGQDSAQKPSREELHSLVAHANNSSVVRSSNLNFTVARGTDIDIVEVKDSQTGELIRQIPSEAMVAIARTIEEQQQGTMLKEKV